ncbi:lipase family protein [Psittacicella gerlachiana]|nr:lipase family protein [Psittacicella gerlachiana]
MKLKIRLKEKVLRVKQIPLPFGSHSLEQALNRLRQLVQSLQNLGTKESNNLAQLLRTTFMAIMFAKLTKAVAKPRAFSLFEGFIDKSEDPQTLAYLGLKAEDLILPHSHYRVKIFIKDPQIWQDFWQPKYILVFKGTGILFLDDWENNIQQALGKESKYYQHAIKLAKAIVSAHKSAEVYAVGHSLGGGLATVFAMVSGAKAITYNAAGISENTLMEARYDCKNIDAYYVKGEALQALQQKFSHQFHDLDIYRWHVNLSRIHPLPQSRGINHIVTAGLTSLDKHFVRTVIRGLNKQLLSLEQQALKLINVKR